MVGGASPLLRRLAAPVALLVVVLAYYRWHESLPAFSLWWNVAWLSFVVFPAVFGLVYFLLPFWNRPWWQLLTAGVVLLLAAFAVQSVGGGLEGNFLKLAGMTMLGFFGATFIEEVWWLVLIGSAIALVDAYSVWRGPTHQIVSKNPHVFTSLSIAFPVPGLPGAARLGLPDVFFFALFLASCPRFGLRTRLTWLTMVLSFGATIALAEWLSRGGLSFLPKAFKLGGLPALPLLALAFLATNEDLLWRAIRRARASGSTP
ncbi:MAG: hypothetical protein ACXVZ2_07425 [Gaiellaceae bacterium]